jgi:predicted SprT family Zn-dependent metalloprotease
MKIIKNLFVLFFMNVSLNAQTKDEIKFDFKNLTTYFEIADKLEKGITPNDLDWQNHFQTKLYKLAKKSSYAIDSINYRKSFIEVWGNNKVEKNRYSEQHYFAKINRIKIEKLTSDLNKTESNLSEKIQQNISEFLSENVKSKVEINSINVYVGFLGVKDATVFDENSISYDFTLFENQNEEEFAKLCSHELYHLIGLRYRKKINFNYSKPIQVLLGSIQEEAIADQIDKSKKYILNKDYINSEEFKTSISKIKNLNEYLAKEINEKDMQTLFTEFGQNGGHIPGRFMGMSISKNDKMKVVLKKQFNPYYFILAYNKSAEKWNRENEIKFPIFEKKSLQKIKISCSEM